LCEKYVDGEKVAIILGDNIVEQDISKPLADFDRNGQGARIFLKEVANPREYGVAQLSDGKIARIVEKPRRPASNLAVIGVYLYDNTIFKIIKTLKPSKRNELEISDVNNIYLRQGRLDFKILKGGWADAGESIAAYNKAINFARKLVEGKRVKK
jgi:glucose-1-phosphate thymidylyltransferase